MSGNNNIHWCKGVLEELQSKPSSSGPPIPSLPPPSTISSTGSNNYSYYQNYPSAYNSTATNLLQTNGTGMNTSSAANMTSNEYYRQYYDYYSRYYAGQTQPAVQPQTNTNSNTTNTITTPSTTTTTTNTNNEVSYSKNSPGVLYAHSSAPTVPVQAPSTQPSPPIPPQTSSYHQMSYSSAPVTYASALLKGQSTWTTNNPVVNPPPVVSKPPTIQTNIINNNINSNSNTWPTPAQAQRTPNPSRFSMANQPPPPTSAPPAQPPLPPTPPPPPSPQPSPSTSSSPWPQSLKLFVEKSFKQCDTDSDRLYVEEQLKTLITKVSNDGRLHQHRWDLEPPPVPPSLQPKPPKPPSSSSSSLLSSSDTTEIKEPRRKKSRFQPMDDPQLLNPFSTSSSATSMRGPSPTPPPQPKQQSNPIISAPVTNSEELNRQNRQNRFMREHTLESNGHHGNKKEKKNSKSSKASAASSLSYYAPPPPPPSSSNTNGTNGTLSEFDLESLIVVGTCQKIEKDYLRLTSAPDPSTVRPFEVLKKALNLVTERWNQSQSQNQNQPNLTENGANGENNNASTTAPTSYIWICSQLKSIRQDVLVQHIKNDFTVLVYEFHGRVALQSGDLNEYNQCQTQLKQLYASGLKGSEMEFTAYRILYYLYLQGNIKYQKGNQDIVHIMSTLTPEAMNDSSVQHALKLRKAISLENYHKIFHLYQHTPNYGRCILDKMIDTWRVKALQKMVKAYKPHLEIDFILKELVFSSSDVSVSGIEFLTKVGGVITNSTEGNEQQVLDTKLSSISSSSIVAQDDQLLL